jgi:hypothetical protein
VSTGEKPRTGVPWTAIDRAAGAAERADRDERERWLAMSDEEVDHELAAAGIDPGEAAGALKAALDRAPAPAAVEPIVTAASTAEPSGVVSLASAREKRSAKRAPRPAWVSLLVAAAVGAVVLGGGGAVYVALREGPPAPVPTTPGPAPEPSAPTPPPEAVAKAEAAKLREKAHAECDDEKWAECKESLAEAARLDADGTNATRDVRRMYDKIQRERAEEERHAKPGALIPRSLSPGRAADLGETLKPYAGQRIDLLCEAAPEPLALCAQLASVFKGAGWAVKKTNARAGTIAFHGMHLEVATGAEDPTEDAADALAKGIDYDVFAYVEGPDDMAPAGAEGGAADAAPLRLTVGPQ